MSYDVLLIVFHSPNNAQPRHYHVELQCRQPACLWNRLSLMLFTYLFHFPWSPFFLSAFLDSSVVHLDGFLQGFQAFRGSH